MRQATSWYSVEGYSLRLRESYRESCTRGFVLRIHGFDSIWLFSKDLIRGFTSWCSFQKIWFMDSICDAVIKRFHLGIQFKAEISKDLTNPHESYNPYEPLLHSCTSDEQILNFWICKSVWCSKYFLGGFDSTYCVQKIQFVDSICGFNLWIQFVNKKIKNVWFILNHRDASTNPATLIFTLKKLMKKKPFQYRSNEI